MPPAIRRFVSVHVTPFLSCTGTLFVYNDVRQTAQNVLVGWDQRENHAIPAIAKFFRSCPNEAASYGNMLPVQYDWKHCVVSSMSAGVYYSASRGQRTYYIRVLSFTTAPQNHSRL